MLRAFQNKFFNKFGWLPGKLFAFAGSFIIAYGWGAYHFSRHSAGLFTGKVAVVFLLVFAGYFLVKQVYLLLVKRTGRHIFWRDAFYRSFDELFFFSSLIFLIFLIKKEWQSLLFCLLLLPIIYYRLQKILREHPGGAPWLEMNKWIFYLVYFIFGLEAALQYSAYHFYILDNNIRFFNIVLFRSFAMTLFWMLGFAVANHWYQRVKGVFRYLVPIFWILLFSFGLLLWTINLGILYYSGLYFSPVAIEHLTGSSGVINNQLTYLLLICALIIGFVFVLLVRKNIRVHSSYGLRYSAFYNYSIGLFALLSVVTLSSFRNTPEHAVIGSFYRYYFGDRVERTLDLELQKKLARFGLIYDTNQFYVNSRSEVFAPTTTKFLASKFAGTKPNILIIELESFSSRLAGPYGTKFADLTPGLDEFAADKNTTLFYNFYNASTPTITGILSQLCSFLPPTGHNEIQNERKLQSHRLLCLPEVLKKHGGYKYAGYVTAVDKSFANKDGIFTGMGVDKVLGTSELQKYISGEPLSWGYSDHQMFPVVFDLMKNAEQPFVYMLSTVDTHPPFDLAKDAVNYGDGSEPVLNMFHTTDDAFQKFWQEFKASDLYKNTIVVAVADHAIFPGALTTNLFKAEADRLTYYDENFFAVYVPDSVLPKKVSVYSSGIDFTPTLLQILDINIPNSFEGHSIFDDRVNYPNLLGMHELGLYINQVDSKGKRKVSYDIPSEVQCSGTKVEGAELSLCEFLQFYEWKRQMFEQGRFWKH